MNILLPLAAIIAALATPSSAPLSTSTAPVTAPYLVFVPAVWMQAEGPENLVTEIGQDGELGETCWTHQNGEIAKSGIIKPDGSIVYDDAPDYSRCASMD